MARSRSGQADARHRPRVGEAGLFAPIGHAEPDGDGALRLTGRFPFNSGSPHATWFAEGALVSSKDGPPQWRFLFLPKSDVEIEDTWRVAGLRGTASHHVKVDGARVPLERTANPLFETAPHPDPQFRWSFFGLLGSLMAGFPLGVARRSIDEFIPIAQTKGRGGAPVLATEQVTQLEVGRCEGALRGARAFVLDSLGATWDSSLAGDRPSREQRVAIRLAASNAMRTGIDVVDTMFHLTGASALFDDSPLQRCWRDVHAARSHIFFSTGSTAVGGQALLGEPTDEARI